MMIQFEDMDEFFREAAGSYELTPRQTAWRRLRRQLLWRRFRYVIGAGVLSLAVLYMLFIAQPGDENMSAVEPSLPHTQSVVASSHDTRQAIVSEKEQSQNDPVVIAPTEKGDKGSGIKRTFAVKGRKSVMDDSDNQAEPERLLQPGVNANSIGRLAPLSAMLLPCHGQIVDPVKRNSSHSASGDSILNVWHWSSDIYGGFGFSQFAGFSGGLPGQKDLRDDGSWLLSPSAGALLRVAKNGWYLSAGLQWNRIGQKVQFDVETTDINPLLSHYDYDTTWVWIYDPPNYGEPWPASVDSTFIAVYYRQKFKGTLAVDYLSVPLMAGYEFRNDFLALGFGAGLVFSFPLSYHGKAPNAALNRLLEASYELSHQLDISLRFQLESAARLRPNYWLFFRPVVGLGVINHSGRQSGLNFRNNSFGLDVGIRIDFNP